MIFFLKSFCQIGFAIAKYQLKYAFQQKFEIWQPTDIAHGFMLELSHGLGSRMAMARILAISLVL